MLTTSFTKSCNLIQTIIIVSVKNQTPNWSNLFRLYVSKSRNQQIISNNAVIENLEKHGDSLEIARPVDQPDLF